MPRDAISSAASAKNAIMKEPTRSSDIESLHDVAHHRDVMDRQRRIDALDGAANLRDERFRRQDRAHQEAQRVDRNDGARQINLRHRRLVQAVVPDVSDDADHLKSIAVRPADASVSTDRVLPRPLHRDRSFVDDDRQQILARIALVEESPAAKGNPQRRKESRADDAETRSLNRLEVRGAPLRVDRRAEATAAERDRIGERGAGDARDPLERADEPLMLNPPGGVGLCRWAVTWNVSR